jgi:hypothetical protein
VLAAIGVLALLVLGAVPLLPVCLRPLREHSNPAVRDLGQILAMLLFWVGFNLSWMSIWGAFRYVPEVWLVLLGVPLLQVPAVWLSYRIAFGSDRTALRSNALKR